MATNQIVWTLGNVLHKPGVLEAGLSDQALLEYSIPWFMAIGNNNS
jgi:hypothetical protein